MDDPLQLALCFGAGDVPVVVGVHLQKTGGCNLPASATPTLAGSAAYAIAEIAGEYKLDTYANQIEIITSEQMLDAYATTGLPVGYPHWSYGKEFIRNEQAYRRGMQGLAYEIVINSSPCIAYLMEENTMTTQALVIAHACYGHNSFFKGNHLFRQWTAADAILDYLVFARRYVMECEQRYGMAEVEEVLDSCHALSEYGVERYRRPQPQSARARDHRLRNAGEPRHVLTLQVAP